MKTDLKKKIEEILRDYFVDRDQDNSWGTPEKVQELFDLFQSLLAEEKKKAKAEELLEIFGQAQWVLDRAKDQQGFMVNFFDWLSKKAEFILKEETK